jgi:hypothetical protein
VRLAQYCATPGGWSGRSGERGARRRGLRGERKAVVEAKDWEGPTTSGSFVLAGILWKTGNILVHDHA